MYYITDVFGVLLRPLAEQSHNRLTVVMQDKLPVFVRIALIPVFASPSLSQTDHKNLLQHTSDLVTIVGLHTADRIRLKLDRNLKEMAKPLLKILLCNALFQDNLHLLVQNPLDQIRNILKMIVKCLSCDVALFYNILYRQFLYFFLKQKVAASAIVFFISIAILPTPISLKKTALLLMLPYIFFFCQVN